MDSSIPPGGDHSHLYPGGGVRNHFEPMQSTGESIFRLIVGGLLSVAIVADDAFGIVADEHLFIGTSAYFVREWVIWKTSLYSM